LTGKEVTLMAVPTFTSSSDPAGAIDRLDDLKQGVLGLVTAVVEGACDTFRTQAGRVMDSGRLDKGQRERLGRALLELGNTLEDIKGEPGVAASVRAVRDDPDGLVDDIVNRLVGTSL